MSSCLLVRSALKKSKKLEQLRKQDTDYYKGIIVTCLNKCIWLTLGLQSLCLHPTLIIA